MCGIILEEIGEDFARAVVAAHEGGDGSVGSVLLLVMKAQFEYCQLIKCSVSILFSAALN